MFTVDITGKTDNRSAVIELEFGVATARALGQRVMAVKHSSGPLQKIARRILRRYKREGKANCVLQGEDLGGDNIYSRYMTERYPELSECEAATDITYLGLQ